MSCQGITIERADHLQSVIEMFERLLQNSSLVDCTIAAEGQCLKAHRVVLSACSSYFELLFSQEDKNYPIVVLKDIKFEDLKAVVDFIYLGKVEIPESRLQRFVNTIESLHIKGMGNVKQYCSDIKTDPESVTVTLLPENRPLEEVREMPMELENGNQFAAAVCRESDISPIASPHPLLDEESSIRIQSPSECVVKCEAETSIKIVESWSKRSNEVIDKVDIEENSILENDEVCGEECITELIGQEGKENRNMEEAPTLDIFYDDAELIGQEGKENGDMEEAPTLDIFEHDAEQLNTTQTKNQKSEAEIASVAPEAASEAPSDLVVTTQETETTTKRNAAIASCNKGPVKILQLKLVRCTEQNQEVPTYTCSHCDKTFIRRNSFLKHRRIHTAGRPYSCTQCPKSFTHRSHLNRHQYTHLEHRQFACTVCSKSFTTKDYLIIHQRIHTGQRPYSCTECHKSFRVKHSMREHQRIHSKLRPFICPLCNKAFRYKCNLTAHQRTHSGERFPCPNCNKTFSLKRGLKLHQRIHTGQRPYSCDDCGKSFGLRESLIEHLRTHTQEQSYSCAECHKLFRYSGSLVAHQRVHTGYKPFFCDHCQASFSRKASLAKHLQRHEQK